jgi:ATP-binding cassette, subfamily C, bacterial EexD
MLTYLIENTRMQKLVRTLHVLAGNKGALLALVLFSNCYNALGIVSAVFMMQVYDRVMTSHSVPTLLVLCALAAVLYLVQGLFRVVRARLLGRIGDRLLTCNEGAILEETARRAAASRGKGKAETTPSQDLETLTKAFKGNIVSCALDAPWGIIYLVALYLIAPMAGMGAAFSVVAMVATALLMGWFKAKPLAEDSRAADQQRAWDLGLRHASGTAAAALP